MKNRILSIVLVLLFSSCEKSSVSENSFEINTIGSLKKGENSKEIILKEKRVTYNSIKKINTVLKSKGVSKKEKKLNNQKYRDESSGFVKSLFLDNSNPTTIDDQQIQTAIMPLVQNGEQIYNELLTNVINTPEWEQLSAEDKNLILNINSEAQFTNLALIFSTPDLSAQIQSMGKVSNTISNRVDFSDVVKDCISVALGIVGIRSVLTGIFTVEKGVSLLRIMGRRYLSYIGIAWMVWDFSDCVSDFL